MVLQEDGCNNFLSKYYLCDNGWLGVVVVVSHCLLVAVGRILFYLELVMIFPEYWSCFQKVLREVVLSWGICILAWLEAWRSSQGEVPV